MLVSLYTYAMVLYVLHNLIDRVVKCPYSWLYTNNSVWNTVKIK